MSPEPARSLTVEHLDFDSFSARRDEWDGLLLASPHPVPFLSHDWLECWWRSFGDGQRFEAIVVHESGEWLAALPLAVRRARPGLTVAEIVGSGPVPTRGMGLADKCCVPLREDRPDALHSLVGALRGKLADVDLIDLKGIDAGAAVAGAFDASGALHKMPRSVSPYLPLDGDWEGYLASRSRNFRKHLKKYWRLLEKRGAMQVERLQESDRASDWVAEIFAVNDASWKAQRGTNLFRAPEIRAFFGELIPAMLSRGTLDLTAIRLDGDIVCYELCFDIGGRLFSYNGAYRSELERESPGTALTAHVIEQAFLRGRREYDMCRGLEGYKQRWSDSRREELELLIPASGLGSRLKTIAGPLFKARLKQWPWVEEQADRLFGALSRRRYRR